MNGFEKHGIDHLSPSSINMYAECQGAWAARYIFNHKFSFGVAAQIGVLTEQVVQDVLLGADFAAALEAAKKEFRKKNALNTSEKDIKRINDIEAMAHLALEELKQYGEPEFIHGLNGVQQQKIEIMCNGGDWSIPVIGFTDFAYPKHGIIFDLKTTLRIPSVMSMAHRRQAAIYRAAKGNMGVKFLYCSPKKCSILEDENFDEALASFKAIAKRLEAFLRAHDKEQIKEIAHVSDSSFYWNGSEKIRKELYSV